MTATRFPYILTRGLDRHNNIVADGAAGKEPTTGSSSRGNAC